MSDPTATAAGPGMWQGRVVSIQIAATASAPMQSVAEARAVPGRGLEGDRYFNQTGFYSHRPSAGGREITLIEIESVHALGQRAGQDDAPTIALAPVDTRRNIATAGVALNHLVDREFWVGAVLLRGVRLCEPCKHLEELTEPGVMAGLVHRGGLRADILTPGTIRPGDPIRPHTAGPTR